MYHFLFQVKHGDFWHTPKQDVRTSASEADNDRHIFLKSNTSYKESRVIKRLDEVIVIYSK